MKLAEALAERKALDARLSSIEGRLRANARIQEGDAVSEDPERLFALLDSTAEELRTLMVRIARTNRETVVDGRSLADWIAERDVSVRRFNILSGVADRASERIERRSADDVRVVPVIDVVARKHEADALAARKELEARLTRLEERLHASARVQEGLEPDESPDALYAMLEKAAAELVEIVSRISRTNVETVVEGRILADWIAERDVSWRRLRVLQSALRAAAPSYDRHGGPGSVRSVTTFSTARRHAELDALALRINAIDARIQQANWETELL